MVSSSCSFIFDRIFIKLAGNQDRHKISDEFEFRPDWISHLGVTYPWGRFKFSIDLLWKLSWPFRWKYTGYLVGATPLTVFHPLFWNFSDVFCIEWRCACALDMILWLFFSHFLYPATQKVAGYYIIPSKLWVSVRRPSVCPSALRFHALTLVPFDLFSSNFA